MHQLLNATAWLVLVATVSNASAEPRSRVAIMKEFTAVSSSVVELMANPARWNQPAFRDAHPEALARVKRAANLLDEYQEQLDREKAPAMYRICAQYFTVASFMGDAESTRWLERLAASDDVLTRQIGEANIVLRDWFSAADDAEARGYVIGSLIELVDRSPSSAAAETMSAVATHATVEELRRLQPSLARLGAADSVAPRTRIEGRLKQFALIGKPLELAGTTVDGKPFSTASLRGRVVVVDFWASWCPPCLAEMPKLQKMYEAHRDKGLELVGVSSDRTIDRLKAYLSRNGHNISWPQLAEPELKGLHPLTQTVGVWGLPAKVVLDRSGIVRAVVQDDQDIERLILPLLTEQTRAWNSR